MTRRGLHLALIRALCFLILTSGLVLAGTPSSRTGLALVAGTFLLYIFLPRPARPETALGYSPIQAVILPDLLGLCFGAVFFALPVWAAPETLEGQDILHPMAWMVWPMATIFLSLSAISWRFDAFVICPEATGLDIDTGRKRHFIAFGEIEEIAPWARKFPRVLRALAPLLVATGHYGQAGAVLLARDSSGFALKRSGQRDFIIPTDGFERQARELMALFLARDVPVAGGLSRYKPRRKTDRPHRKGSIS